MQVNTEQIINTRRRTYSAGVMRKVNFESMLTQSIPAYTRQVTVTKTAKLQAESSKSEVQSVVRRVITERDREIIGLINRFGFITADKLALIYGISENRMRRRLKVLVDYELLKHERLLSAYPGVYWPTRDGKELSGNPLTPIVKPRFATFEHELAVIDVYLEVKQKYGDSINWITAREIMSNRLAHARDAKEAFRLLKSKIPDALIMREGKKFAVEVELSLKGLPRLKKILADYNSGIAQGAFDGVLYYTDKETVFSRLTQILSGAPMARQFQILRLTNGRHSPDAAAK